jgi:hypothetical protein
MQSLQILFSARCWWAVLSMLFLTKVNGHSYREDMEQSMAPGTPLDKQLLERKLD